MTVKELREAIATLPDDMPVLLEYDMSLQHDAHVAVFPVTVGRWTEPSPSASPCCVVFNGDNAWWIEGELRKARA